MSAQNKLKSFIYDSDHGIVSMKILLRAHKHFEIDENKPNIKYNYNKANWPKFKTNWNDNNNIDTTNDRNLTMDEIDKYI